MKFASLRPSRQLQLTGELDSHGAGAQDHARHGGDLSTHRLLVEIKRDQDSLRQLSGKLHNHLLFTLCVCRERERGFITTCYDCTLSIASTYP